MAPPVTLRNFNKNIATRKKISSQIIRIYSYSELFLYYHCKNPGPRIIRIYTSYSYIADSYSGVSLYLSHEMRAFPAQLTDARALSGCPVSSLSQRVPGSFHTLIPIRQHQPQTNI